MDRPLLVNEFEEMGLSISDDILDECIIICHTYKITASDLVGSWIAYCASSQIDANDLSKERLMILVKSFKVDSDNKRKSLELKSYTNNFTSLSTVHKADSIKSSTYGTSNIKIENEINIKDIIDGHNIKEEENTISTAGDIACDFGLGNINKNSSDNSADIEEIFLYKQDLFKKFVFGRVDYQKFENHVQTLVDDIVKNNNLQPAVPLSELFCTNDNEITISGCLKLIKKELFLSSSYGSIKLDLSEAGKLDKSLFANQILVVTGTNTDSKVFKVRKLYTNASLPLSPKIPKFAQGNMNIIVAAGPFFSESSPQGKSLKSLIEKTINLKAKLLVLLGPIFETDFVTQLNKSSSETYDELLEFIIQPLFNHPNTRNTKLVIFSSWKDANSYCVYPTPPFTESRLPTLYPNNIFIVSDPTIFSANNVLIAGNASDALMGLHVSGINKIQEETFEKLSKQIVWQQSLHPSYTASPTIPVDQFLWLEHCNFEEFTPHIILTTSQLRSFIRVVENTMVINVGQLVKSNSQKKLISGTYCKIQITPPKDGHWSPKTNISAQVIHI
ncbi:DNA polymerase alpha/epsilon, subunit B [Cinara cedri]|uniref:DNA polymerase alpha subunit B n=1 Tax=Cinara cedri TaxID=506608 RepID=A0A5E4NFH8_9HEMI|nr:DNA polymerase alpha/epsilon, subunit B [Cinara cedri]